MRQGEWLPRRLRFPLTTTALRVLLSAAILVATLDRPATGRASSPRLLPAASVLAGMHLLGPGAQSIAGAQPAPDVGAIVAHIRQQRGAHNRLLAPAHDDFSLHGVGSQLYTAWNAPVTLKAINWYGFEYSPFVPDGLDRAPLDSILFGVRHLGFNALRMTFADQTVRSNPVVVEGLTANPGLRGLHTLDILKRIVQRAHVFGLRVILCDSRSEAGRGPELASGLWYTWAYPESVWTADWIRLATLLRPDSAFVGADLRNELHDLGNGSVTTDTYLKDGPLWGPYHGTHYWNRDWHWAAQKLGNILLGINPHLLIIVEGIQVYVDPSDKLSGGLWGSNLIGVQYDPIQLTKRSQIVYSVHEYGPHMWQADWFNLKTTYASLARRWTDLWGYLLNANQTLRAPIFVGEFGTCHDYWSCITDTAGWKQGFWFKSFAQYLHQHPQVGWAYWSLNPTGPFRAQDPNFYSLVSSDWHHYYPLVTRGLAPLLSEPDGTGMLPSTAHPQALLPVPGCSPYRSCVTISARPAKPFPVTVSRGVPYVQPADPYRSGDLYVPQGTGPAARPAVVVVHGGTWDTGSKGTPGTVYLARGLAQHGYVTFDINYRPTGHGGQYPGSIQDVEDAVAYLATQRQKLHLDLGKIGVVGASAGAYLALMAGYRFNIAPYVPPHYRHTSVHIAAVGSFFGPVELKASVQQARGLPWVQKLAAYLGVTFDRKPVTYRMASPLRYIQTAVPTIFWDGTADPTTPPAQAFELYKRLKQRQIRAQLMSMRGAPYSLARVSQGTRDTALIQLIAFLDDTFARASS